MHPSELNSANATQVVYTNEPIQYGSVISQRRSSTTHWLHADALGSTRILTTSAGASSDTYLYDAWGNVITSSGSTVNPFRWVGRYGYYFDTVTGLFYIRARTYQPSVARWTSVDPIGVIDGVIHWLYSDNRPIIRIDPSGAVPILIAVPPLVWVCGCYAIERIWKRDFALRVPLESEQRCINKAKRLMPWRAACSELANIHITTQNSPPKTLCNPMCALTSGFGSNLMFFTPGDMKCATCFDLFNLLSSLIHECHHTRQPCSWRTADPMATERDAYGLTALILRRLRKKCDDYVKNNLCATVKECHEVFDDLIQTEEEGIEINRP